MMMMMITMIMPMMVMMLLMSTTLAQREARALCSGRVWFGPHMACVWPWANRPAPKKKRTVCANDAELTEDIVIPYVRNNDELASRFVKDSGAEFSEAEMQSYYSRCNEILDEVLDDVRLRGKRKRVGVDLIGKTGLCAVPRIPVQVWPPDECPPTCHTISEYMTNISWTQTCLRRASGNDNVVPM